MSYEEELSTSYLFNSPSGALFCPRTGFVRLSRKEADVTKMLADPEFNHEAFHYLSSMMTSAGLFLSTLRYARARHIRTAILRYEDVRDEGFDISSLANRMTRKIRKKDLASVLDPTNDSVKPIEFEIAKLKLAEVAFMSMSKVIEAIEEAKLPIAGIVLEGQLSATKEICHKFGIDCPWYESMDVIKPKIVESYSRPVTLPRSPKYGRFIDTYDIFEAFSVAADLSFIYETRGLDVAADRFRQVEGTGHGIVLDSICEILGIDYSGESIAKFLPSVFAILDTSLDVQVCPHTSAISDGAGWDDIYPPAKLLRVAGRAGQIGAISYPVSFHEIQSFKNKLQDGFMRATLSLNLPLKPSFFEMLAEVDLETLEYKGRDDRQKKKIDILDYYFDLYFSFKKFEHEKGFKGISEGFAKGVLPDFRYCRPPIVFHPGGIIAASKHMPDTFLLRAYSAFSTIIGMDDYYFNDEEVSVFPFEVSNFSSGEWHNAQLQLMLMGIEEMKKVYS